VPVSLAVPESGFASLAVPPSLDGSESVVETVQAAMQRSDVVAMR
jgi:hypothetical protein